MVFPLFPGQGNVPGKAAAGRAGEFQAHLGIQAHPGRAEEILPVQQGGVDTGLAAFVERFHRFRRDAADAQVQRQAVSAAAGDDAQRLPAAHKPPGHFAHRAVSAHGHHHIGLHVPGQFFGLAGPFRKLHPEPIKRAVKMFLDGCQNTGFVFPPGDGIHDKANVFHSLL